MRKNGLWINEREFIQFSDKQTSLSDEIATRKGSIDFYSLGMYLPNPDPVLKKIGKDISVYKDLLADGHLGGCVTSRKSGVKSLEWEIDRGKAKTRPVKLIEDLFRDLDLDRIIGEMLDAPLYGYQPLEVLWQQTGPYWLPRDIVGKPQKWFVFDEENELRLLTRENYTNGIELQPRKFLIIQHEATYENPYGFPVLSRCFWPLTFKKGGYKFWVTFTEKFGSPYLVGKHPRNIDKKEIDRLADMLEAMVQDAIAVIPDDSSVDILGNEVKGSSDLYDRLIESCKGEISVAVLGQNLTTQVSGGSLAAAQSHMEVRDDIVDSDKRLVVRAMNTLIGWIYELNFSGGERPVFSMYEEEDVDTTLAERDETLSRAGVRLSKGYYTREYGFQEGDVVAVDGAQNAQEKSAAAAAFAETPVSPFPDQDALDDAIDSIPAESLQRQAEGILKPVLDLIDQGATHEDLMEQLTEAYPDMKTKALEDMLARAIFVSEIWGRLNANKA